MNIKTWSLVVVALAGLQMSVAYAITRANSEFFNNRPASHYGKAIRDLAKHRPLAAAGIRLCYVLSFLEVLGLAVAKYV
jgi:hypothetical protein